MLLSLLICFCCCCCCRLSNQSINIYIYIYIYCSTLYIYIYQNFCFQWTTLLFFLLFYKTRVLEMIVFDISNQSKYIYIYMFNILHIYIFTISHWTTPFSPFSLFPFFSTFFFFFHFCKNVSLPVFNKIICCLLVVISNVY